MSANPHKRKLTSIANDTHDTTSTSAPSEPATKKAKTQPIDRQHHHKHEDEKSTADNDTNKLNHHDASPPQIDTQIWTIDGSSSSSATDAFADYLKNPCLQAAAAALRSGQVVAFPTETVYGLGANAFDNQACHKIFTAKGRPSDNPLIVHIANRSQLPQWILDPVHSDAYRIPLILEKLMDRYWPGPLSIIFPYPCKWQSQKLTSTSTSSSKSTPIICDKVRGNGQLQSVAVRMPGNAIARALITLAQCPIAAPSANTSGRPSPTRGQHVIHDMKGKVFGIVDAGEVACCDVGLESTIVKLDDSHDTSQQRIVILRPGGVTKEMITAVVDECQLSETVRVVHAHDIAVNKDKTSALASESKTGASTKAKEEEEVVEAPGMKYRHYAPKKPLFLVASRQLFADIYEYYKAKNVLAKIAFMVTSENVLMTYQLENKNVLRIGTSHDLNGIGANLFKTLRIIDDEAEYQDIEVIFCEVFEENEVGVAIMNRLKKASQSNEVINGLKQIKQLRCIEVSDCDCDQDY